MHGAQAMDSFGSTHASPNADRMALNRNHARRDEILSTTELRYSAGIKPFTDLSVHKLRQLLDEGFIHLDCRQNCSPSTQEFLRFMERWPAVRARGYAVSRRREDYRVTLDGIECDLRDIPFNDIDKFQSEFEFFCR